MSRKSRELWQFIAEDWEGTFVVLFLIFVAGCAYGVVGG